MTSERIVIVGGGRGRFQVAASLREKAFSGKSHALKLADA